MDRSTTKNWRQNPYRYRKNMSGEATFYSFIPMPLTEIEIKRTDKLALLLQQTEAILSELKRESLSLRKEKIMELQRLEAESSWQLTKGIRQASYLFSEVLGDVILDEEDKVEIENTHKAHDYAINSLQDLPISSRLLKNAHFLMTNSSRYNKKYPGEYRSTAIWLGRAEENLKTAMYVPPIDVDMNAALNELENYIHYNDKEDILVKAALIHYQFEAIHPFIDANGRIGRLLNALYLYETQIDPKSILLLSKALQKQSSRYYKTLQLTHETSTFEEWVYFFIERIREAAKLTIETIRSMDL